MRSGVRRTLIAFVSILAPLSIGLPAVRAAGEPSLRVISTRDEVTIRERTRGGIGIDLGVWIAAANGDFEVRLSRPDYLTDITASQTTSTGVVIRPIPPEDLLGWYGLNDFLHISIKDEAGRAVYRLVQPFCPGGWDQDRVDDSGPANPTYPQWCGGNPFTLSTVWGIDRGWAVNALQWTWIPGRVVPAGHYDIRVWIDPTFTELLQIAPEDAEAHVALTVKRRLRSSAASDASDPAAAAQRLDSVPVITPSSSVIPNLAALPAWGVYAMHRRGRDYLRFGATVWNGGPSPMIVEGYREPDSDVMDGWQYFTDALGNVVGKAEVGQLEYDARPGHEHWHFEQFADYALTDATQTEVVRSEKVSFCLAPTDPIDLLLPTAERVPYTTGFFSACGEPGSLWVRETLPVGWGDTYYQYLPGQSFDITDLPNGKYFIRVQVNPLGALYDATGADDTSYRRVLLRGTPGNRRVVVPPYQGIDTEGCFGCFLADGQPRYDGLPSGRLPA